MNSRTISSRLKEIIKKNKFLVVIDIIHIIFLILLIVFSKIEADIFVLLLSFGIVACFLLTIFSPLFSRRRINKFELVSILTSFPIFTFIMALFIFEIKDTVLKEIFLTILASLLGGGMTLFGVLITIKNNEVNKREDEIKKYKPRFFVITASEWQTSGNRIQSSIETKAFNNSSKKDCKVRKSFSLFQIFLKTYDLAPFIYEGLIIDNKKIIFDFPQVLQKDTYYLLHHDIKIKSKKEPNFVSLIVSDLLENKYLARLSFEIIESNSIKITNVESLESYDINL